MMGRRSMRVLRLFASGAIMLQIAGCSTAQFFEFAQTVFLGITAAGSVAILQNI